MNKLVLITAILLFTVITGCTAAPEQKDDISNDTPEETKQTETKPDPTVEIHPTGDYSLHVDNEVITLKDWEHEIGLKDILGTAVSENVEQLGEGADTLTGSFIKKVEYDGLQMELFSPKHNGEEFWILSMAVSKQGYQTSGGIEVGKTVEEVKAAYPDIEPALDGRTDPNNCAYEKRDEESYNVLQFEVKDGLVSGINMFHIIP